MSIKGKVDLWRIERLSAWKIVEGFRGSKDMPQPYDFYSLPYDDELREADKNSVTESLEEWYKLAQSELADIIWKK